MLRYTVTLHVSCFSYYGSDIVTSIHLNKLLDKIQSNMNKSKQIFRCHWRLVAQGFCLTIYCNWLKSVCVCVCARAHGLREERVLSQPVHRTATYRRDDTRGCIVQFCPPDDEHMCSKHVEAWNKLIIKFSASSWLILINKYIEMLSQQNIKICPFVL